MCMIQDLEVINHTHVCDSGFARQLITLYFLNHIEIHLIMYIMIQGLNTCIDQKFQRKLIVFFQIT